MEPSTPMLFQNVNTLKCVQNRLPWVPKYFFEDMELFKALLDYHNKVLYRFEVKTLGERNKALKILERKRL